MVLIKSMNYSGVGYFIYKYLEDKQNGTSIFREQNSALDILNERYAKGEIDEET